MLAKVHQMSQALLLAPLPPLTSIPRLAPIAQLIQMYLSPQTVVSPQTPVYLTPLVVVLPRTLAYTLARLATPVLRQGYPLPPVAGCPSAQVSLSAQALPYPSE